MLPGVAMRSPLPGMNPYLENLELRSEVHSRLIVAIADDLTDLLSEKYRVAIEKRTYFNGGDDSLLVGIPDVSVVGKQPEQNQPSATATLPPLVEPITVTVPMAEEVARAVSRNLRGGNWSCNHDYQDFVSQEQAIGGGTAGIRSRNVSRGETKTLSSSSGSGG